jgi:hypothetical protein
LQQTPTLFYITNNIVAQSHLSRKKYDD